MRVSISAIGSTTVMLLPPPAHQDDLTTPGILPCTATRVGSPHFGQTSITFEISIGPSNWIRPGLMLRPACVCTCFWCLVRMFTPCTTRRRSSNNTLITSPRLPLSSRRPLMTSTVSPLRILTLIPITPQPTALQEPEKRSSYNLFHEALWQQDQKCECLLG